MLVGRVLVKLSGGAFAGLPIDVIDVTEERCLRRVIDGENVGTRLAAGIKVEIE